MDSAQNNSEAPATGLDQEPKNVKALQGVCHLEGSVSSVIVSGCIQGQCTECLVDTGATVSLIPEHLVKGAVAGIEGTENVKSVDGGSLQIIGRAVVSVGLGIWETQQEFLVTRVKLSGPILGADFLIKHGMVVDWR